MPIKNWYEDRSDTELSSYIPILEKLAYVDDVRNYLSGMHGMFNNIDFARAREVLAAAVYIRSENKYSDVIEEEEKNETSTPGNSPPESPKQGVVPASRNKNPIWEQERFPHTQKASLNKESSVFVFPNPGEDIA